MRTAFLCISVLRVASGPIKKLVSFKSALNPRWFTLLTVLRRWSILVLLFDALWFILRGDVLYVLPCAILSLCFSVLLALRLPRLGKRELILVLFVCLIDLCLFGCRFPLPLNVLEGLFSYFVCSLRYGEQFRQIYHFFRYNMNAAHLNA